MPKRIVTVFFLFLLFPGYSQTEDLDSLYNAFNSAKSEEDKITLSYSISYEWLFINPDSSLAIANRFTQLARDNKLNEHEALGLSQIAMAYWFQGYLDTSLNYFQQSLDLSKKLEMNDNIAACYGNIGLIYKNQGKFQQAINNSQYMDSFARANNDTLKLYKNMVELASLYEKQGLFKLGLPLIREAITYYEKKEDHFALAFAYNLAGILYRQTYDFANAASAFQLSIASDSLSDRINNISTVYLNLCNMYLSDPENVHLAEKYNELARAQFILDNKPRLIAQYICNKSDIYSVRKEYEKGLQLSLSLLEGEEFEYLDHYSQNYVILQVADLYYQLSDYANADKYALLALEYTEINKSLLNKLSAYEILYKTDSAKGNYESAFYHHLFFQQTSDSIALVDYQQRIAELNIKYESDRKNQENLKLRAENRVKTQSLNLLGFITGSVLILAGLLIWFTIVSRKRRNQLDKLNKELNQKAIDLEESNKTKDLIFSVIAHDLRSSLSGQMQLHQILQDENNEFDEDLRKESMQLLHDNSRSTFQLLNNLLDWSLTKRGRISKQLEPFNLLSKTSEACSGIKQMADNKGIESTFNIPEPILVVSDQKLYSSVIFNLYSNAYKFTPGGGKIVIKAEKTEKDKIRISVSDSGMGIPKEKLDQLNDGILLKSTRGTNNESGIGIGLSICVNFLDLLGSKLEISSEAGKGSTFSFEL